MDLPSTGDCEANAFRIRARKTNKAVAHDLYITLLNHIVQLKFKYSQYSCTGKINLGIGQTKLIL